MIITQLNIVLAVLGALLLILGLTSGLIKRLHASEPLAAVLAGILLGPYGLDVFSIGAWVDLPTLLHEAARFTLAIAVMEAALRLPDFYMFRQWRGVAVMLGLVMPLMWLISGAVIGVIMGLPPLLALLIGGVIASTDPVIASAIVTGDAANHLIPARIRSLMTAESGANDGFAHLFVALPLLLLSLPLGEAIRDWSLHVLLWEVFVAAAIGLVMGYLAGRTMYWCRDRLHAERTSLQSIGLALSITVMGIVGLLGGNDVLAVFAAGIGLNAVVSGRLNEEKAQIQEVVKRFFELPIFVLFGMVIPAQGWIQLGWKAPALAVAILLLRRIPAMLLIRPLVPELHNLTDALFVGWFGPVGIAAILYASHISQVDGSPIVWVITSLIIASSVLAHGLTATPLTRWYGKHNDVPPETVPPQAIEA